jgi:hypothetical protein
VECGFVCLYSATENLDEVDFEFDDDNQPDIAIEAVFELVYEITDRAAIEDSDLRHFASANGTHNAWPYWREYAQSATLRLGVTPYIAPPFKLPSVHDPEPDSAPEGEAGDPGEASDPAE